MIERRKGKVGLHHHTLRRHSEPHTLVKRLGGARTARLAKGERLRVPRSRLALEPVHVLGGDAARHLHK